MTSPQKILLALSRLPRGTRFTSLGRINRPMADLQADLGTSRCSFLEVHAADGTVRGLAPQDLATLREPLLAQVQPAFVVAFTADQHSTLPIQDARPNLYAALEADEALSASPAHQPRFLSPASLRSHLHALSPRSLNPDDYAHRLAEIDTAGSCAPDTITASRIRSFRTAAAKYLAASSSDVPEGKLWTTDPAFLREDATLMPREVLPCPMAEEAEAVGPIDRIALPADENAPLPRPSSETTPADKTDSPIDSVQAGQFALLL